MTDFDKRLQQAIHRGRLRGDAAAREAQAKALSEEELRRLHTKYRLHLAERIEQCLQMLPNHFPGFRTETVYGDRGWGAACSRDDFVPSPGGRRDNHYSRLELAIRPVSSLFVLELTGKGTIRNKEVFSRTFFQPIAEADVEEFERLIEAWTLEYAELYAIG